MDEVLALNIVGYSTLLFTLGAGLLIVSPRPKVKLLGISCYYITNAALFCNYAITGASSFMISGLIFTGLTTVNLIRVLRQMRRGTCQN